jgi:hypothetical protein
MKLRSHVKNLTFDVKSDAGFDANDLEKTRRSQARPSLYVRFAAPVASNVKSFEKSSP